MDAFMEDLLTNEARKITCAPYRTRWIQFNSDYQLAWNYGEFNRQSHQSVPDFPGVYCFFVGHPGPSLPPVGYPLYAGQTERTLYIRYGDYLREKDSKFGRAHVRKFLNVFWGEVLFAFAVFSGDRDQVITLERRLNDALMPAYSRNDFSADTKAKRSAWQ
jgi:hypothetical protein